MTVLAAAAETDGGVARGTVDTPDGAVLVPTVPAPALEPAEPGEPPAADVGRSSARGFLWTTLAWACNRLAILGLTLLLARLLAPADFGIVTAALTLIAMLDAALDLGVGAAVIAEQEHGITHRVRTAFTLNVAISAAIAAVGAACSPLIAALFHASDHAEVFALIFCYPLFRGAGQVQDAVLKRDLLFRRRTLVDISRAVVRIAVSIPLALLIGGAISIAAGIVASELVAMLLLWRLVPMLPNLRPVAGSVRSLLGFGGQVTIIRILGSFRSNFDYVVVGAALGATALGFYGMAYKLPELLIENLLWIFSTIALSAYSRARATGNDALLDAMVRMTRLLSLYGLAVGTALAVVARDAVPVLFSDKWAPTVVPMILIALSLGAMAIGWASGDVFSALGRPGTLVWLDVASTVVMAVSFVLSTRWGLLGVASVHLGFNLLYAVARLILARRVTGVSGRAIYGSVLPGLAVAALTALTGGAVLLLTPSGTFVSLLLVSAGCGVGIVGGSLLFARRSVVDAVRMVLPGRARAMGPTGASA